MVLIRQAIWVHKMGILAAKFLCPFIHDVGKGRPVAAGDVLGHGKGDLIGRAYQDGRQALFHGNRLPHIHGNVIALPGGIEDGIVGEGHHFIQTAPLRGDEGSEDLGSAGRVLS